MVLDKGPLTFSCEGCGRELTKTIGWIKRHPHFSCDCGVPFDAEEFIRSIEETERQVDKLRRSIDRSDLS